MNAEALSSHLDLLVLTALQAGPAHGYATAVALRSGGDTACDLPEGTLYPVLHRLEHAGLLSSRWSDVNGRRRRVYQLTERGQRALAKRQRVPMSHGDRVFPNLSQFVVTPHKQGCL
jgi:PadR family transcriptional regulator, regulatory protein PadR